MKNSFIFYSKAFFKKTRESGFTLIEIIMAIVIIGVAVPSIMIPFSGLNDTKGPEYTVQASFLAQERMEELANEDRTSILTACPLNPSSASLLTQGPGSAYTLACTSVQVNATAPDTSTTSTFAQKITLTVTRADMADLTFNQLFALD
jgi:prepilin-type N-terminal cleavage/methylation domain-containing protein